MQTYYWNPWSIFEELERAMFSSASSSEWPVFDIEDSEDETILTADLPGMTDDDVEVSVSAPMLIIRGERSPKNGRHVRRNRWHGTFERRFHVGDSYDLDNVKAHIADGVLTIQLAKAAKAKPRRIKLTSGVVDRVKGLLTGGKNKAQAEQRGVERPHPPREPGLERVHPPSS